jgi:hypothetical protein
MKSIISRGSILCEIFCLRGLTICPYFQNNCEILYGDRLQTHLHCITEYFVKVTNIVTVRNFKVVWQLSGSAVQIVWAEIDDELIWSIMPTTVAPRCRSPRSTCPSEITSPSSDEILHHSCHNFYCNPKRRSVLSQAYNAQNVGRQVRLAAERTVKRFTRNAEWLPTRVPNTWLSVSAVSRLTNLSTDTRIMCAL